MFSLFVDRQQKVLHVPVHGVLTEQVMADIDADVRAFLRAEGPHRRIMDATHVTRIDISQKLIESRARNVPVEAEVTPARVYVAPTPYLFAMCRMFTTYQAAQGAPPTEVVSSFEAACKWLWIETPDLRPVERAAA